MLLIWKRFFDRLMVRVSTLGLVGGMLFSSPAAAQTAISVIWRHSLGSSDAKSGKSEERLLRSFTWGDLKALQGGRLRATRPGSGRLTDWKGPRLAAIIEESMKSLQEDAQSLVDLVILYGRQGGQAWIPRFFVHRFPMLLADSSLDSILPSNSGAASSLDLLPQETYWVKEVERVELTSYREHFGRFYLERRADPAAVRGEKVFVQNCLACHGSASKKEAWLNERHGDFEGLVKGHPRAMGYRKVNPEVEKALARYWLTYHSEKAASPTEKR